MISSSPPRLNLKPRRLLSILRKLSQRKEKTTHWLTRSSCGSLSLLTNPFTPKSDQQITLSCTMMVGSKSVKKDGNVITTCHWTATGSFKICHSKPVSVTRKINCKVTPESNAGMTVKKKELLFMKGLSLNKIKIYSVSWEFLMPLEKSCRKMNFYSDINTMIRMNFSWEESMTHLDKLIPKAIINCLIESSPITCGKRMTSSN